MSFLRSLVGVSAEGVITLSLIDRNLPSAADFDAWDFSGLACRSVVHIGPISLNVTTPLKLLENLLPRDPSSNASQPVSKCYFLIQNFD